MATYLKFHQLERSPFEGAGSDRLVLATEALRRAFAEIKIGLEEGAPRICLSGGPGIGKSSLARALPKLLAQDVQCVLLRDPSRGWVHLKATIIKQLGLEAGQLSRASLVNARRDGRRIAIVVDQAEHLPAESLEHLDVVLGYKDDRGEQLVHGILLANLEGAPRGQDVPLLWWLDKLTTRQLTLAPIPEAGLRSYIDKHLKKAGAADGSIFEDAAIVAIHRYTGGVPGAVSALCEQLLNKAASRNTRTVTAALVAGVFGDTVDPTPRAARAATRRTVPEPEESLIDHSNTPPPPEETRSAGALPQFGERRSARPPQRRAPAHDSGAPEPELEVQQGLLPVEDSNNYREEPDFFAIPASETEAAPRRRAPRSGPAPRRGRGAGLARKLITLGILAVLAAAAHAGWSAWQELQAASPPATARKAKKPAGPGVAALPAAQKQLENLAALVGAKRERAEAEAEADDAAPIVEDPEAGLTSDLKLGADVPKAGNAESESDGEPSLSIDELYEIAQKAKAEKRPAGDASEEFEPWTQQGPETLPAAPAPTR